MTPKQELWYKAQNQLEAERLLDLIHTFERLNINYALKYEVLRRAGNTDSDLYDFASFSSLAQRRIIKRYETLTGKKYVFKQSKMKRSFWEEDNERDKD